MNHNLNIHADKEATSRAAADFLIRVAQEAIAAKGQFILSLAGGSTPKRLYEILAEPAYKGLLDWTNVHVIWGDERCVPETSPQSNSRMAKEAWLRASPIPASNLYAVNGTLAPEAAAAVYESQLKSLFKDNIAAIDLCLLGLGDDGHTASLFPHTEILKEEEAWVSAVYVEKMESWRISLTAPLIRASSNIAFLVSGAKKVDILPEVLNGTHQPTEYPSQLIIKDNPKVHWFLDEAAAEKSRA